MLSNLPGLNKAGSRVSRRLVAPSTTTPFSSSTPSISVKNCVSILEPDSLLVPRAPANESISSKKSTQGMFSRARTNKSRILDSDSPTTPFRSSGPFTWMKCALASLATTFAKNVLPQPGGPKRRIPLVYLTPNCRNNSGCVKGISIASCRASLTSPNPATSFQPSTGLSVTSSTFARLALPLIGKRLIP